MSHRYFRASEAVYEGVRAGLDASFGLPERGMTSIEPAATAPRDADGMVVVAADVPLCNRQEVAAILSQLIASGDVEEIAAEGYWSAFPTLP